jgi:hypothetical protein
MSVAARLRVEVGVKHALRQTPTQCSRRRRRKAWLGSRLARGTLNIERPTSNVEEKPVVLQTDGARPESGISVARAGTR